MNFYESNPALVVPSVHTYARDQRFPAHDLASAFGERDENVERAAPDLDGLPPVFEAPLAREQAERAESDELAQVVARAVPAKFEVAE